MHRLTGSIYAAVGVNLGLRNLCLVVVIVETATHWGTRESLVVICIHTVCTWLQGFILYVNLAIGICSECFDGFLAIAVDRHNDVDLCSRHGCTGGSVEHNHTTRLARKHLYYRIQIAYTQQMTLDRHAYVVG